MRYCFPLFSFVVVVASGVAIGQTKPAAIDDQLRLGVSALEAGEYPTASACFVDVLGIDRGNVQALHGMALAHVGAGRVKQAVEPIELAMELATAPSSKFRPTRAMVLNFAVIQIGINRPMRAAKYLCDYLEAHPTPPDEQALGIIAVSLYNADRSLRRAALYTKSVEFHNNYKLRIEAEMPDRRLWGLTWVSVSEFVRLDADRQRDEQQLASLADAAMALWEQANQAITRCRQVELTIGATLTQQDAARRERDRVLEIFAKAKAKYEDGLAQARFPTYPRRIETVAWSANETPAVGTDLGWGSTVVAASPRVGFSGPRNNPPAPNGAQSVVAPVAPVRNTIGRTPPPATKLEQPLTQAVVPQIVTSKKVVASNVERIGCAFAITESLVVAPASVVAEARQIELHSIRGELLPCTLVRSDPQTGLALLQIEGATLVPLKIAEKLNLASTKGVNLRRSSLGLELESVSGTIKTRGDATYAEMLKSPSRAGSPILSPTGVVGVAMNDAGTPKDDIPVVPLAKLREFLGDRLPTHASGSAIIAPQSVYEVRAIVGK